MVTPPKGDLGPAPLNDQGKKTAQAWDPAKDEASGEQCRAYGVGGLMRIPGRMHITWQDDTTLKLEADAGTQTRLLAFGSAGGREGDWQGVSTASWDRSAAPLTIPPFVARGSAGGSLKVVTTRMRPGYLARNGIPYSANATITEYFDRFDVSEDYSLLVVSTEVVDPVYLFQPFWTSVQFKKQKDASGWNPSPCSAR
jgi:hypothetical protein